MIWNHGIGVWVLIRRLGGELERVIVDAERIWHAWKRLTEVEKEQFCFLYEGAINTHSVYQHLSHLVNRIRLMHFIINLLMRNTCNPNDLSNSRSIPQRSCRTLSVPPPVPVFYHDSLLYPRRCSQIPHFSPLFPSSPPPPPPPPSRPSCLSLLLPVLSFLLSFPPPFVILFPLLLLIGTFLNKKKILIWQSENDLSFLEKTLFLNLPPFLQIFSGFSILRFSSQNQQLLPHWWIQSHVEVRHPS